MNEKQANVLSYLLEHGSITQMEAWDKFKASRLSSIMFRLKAKGYIVETIWETDGVTRWKRYFLKEAA